MARLQAGILGSGNFRRSDYHAFIGRKGQRKTDGGQRETGGIARCDGEQTGREKEVPHSGNGRNTHRIDSNAVHHTLYRNPIVSSIIKRDGLDVHAELFFATYAIALVCMRMGFRNYFDKVPYRRFLAICTASAVVSMLLLGFAGHNIGLAGAAIFMAGGFGIICSESQATAMAMTDNTKRGLANNTYLIGLDSGMALGPIVGGFLYGHVPAEFFYPCLMVTAVLSTIVYIMGKRKLGVV